MRVNELVDLFKKHDDLYRGDLPGVRRKDLTAFNILDNLVPGKGDLVAATEHDEIFLGVSLTDLAASAITEAEVKMLVMCGVGIDSYGDSLHMFV